MDRIDDESIWLRSPARADVFVGREPRECLQAPSEVVGVNEVLQVLPKLVVTLVVEALDGVALNMRQSADPMTLQTSVQ